MITIGQSTRLVVDLQGGKVRFVMAKTLTKKELPEQKSFLTVTIIVKLINDVFVEWSEFPISNVSTI